MEYYSKILCFLLGILNENVVPTFAGYCYSYYYNYYYYCDTYWAIGSIVGAVIGGIIGFVIVIVIIAALCGACKTRGNRGTVVQPAHTTTVQTLYQGMYIE
ncbi:uncharacterized protein LOC134709924 [Mytilus trossulus]|uniref:uncharacterized protein LOC134709924 n=1 Tax=Mytilus trossulus TaxID=6551 RepID=UPI0030054C0B